MMSGASLQLEYYFDCAPRSSCSRWLPSEGASLRAAPLASRSSVTWYLLSALIDADFRLLPLGWLEVEARFFSAGICQNSMSMPNSTDFERTGADLGACLECVMVSRAPSMNVSA